MSEGTTEHENHSSAVHEEGEEGEPWLVSYADMMTLLFGFFVLMYTFAAAKLKDDSDQMIKVRKELAAYFGGEKSDQTDKKESGDTKELFSPNVGLEIGNSGAKKKTKGSFAESQAESKLKNVGELDLDGGLGGVYVSADDLSKSELGGLLKLKKFVDSEDALELIIADKYLFEPASIRLSPAGEDALNKICNKMLSLRYPFFVGVTGFSRESTSPEATGAAQAKKANVTSLDNYQKASDVLNRLAKCVSESSKGSRMSAMGVGRMSSDKQFAAVVTSGIIIRLHAAVDL